MTDSPNHLTLEAYNKNIDAYIRHTPLTPEQSPSTMLEWIDISLSFIPQGGTILELGSAIPRDARYIRSKGYKVQCSDGAIGFVNYLKTQGENAIYLDILGTPIDNTYSMIFANAVLSHFTKDDLSIVFKRVHDALLSNGVFAFSVKRGNGEEWVTEKMHDKRFIHYWQSDDIVAFIEGFGFNLVFSSSNTGNFPDHEWMNITAVKK